jgi:HK97 family phage prohead protease
MQVKAVGSNGEVEGYASVFGVLDNYDDIIVPGAFADSMAAHKAAGTMPAMLREHSSREAIGVWTDIVEDGTGLFVRGQLAMNTHGGKEAYELMKMKAVSGLSIGFMPVQWTYNTTTDVRTLTGIDLWEVSLVTFPANPQARVTNVKSALETIAAPKDAERVLREAGFSKADSTAIVARVMRMGEARRESAESTAEAFKAATKLLQSITSR